MPLKIERITPKSFYRFNWNDVTQSEELYDWAMDQEWISIDGDGECRIPPELLEDPEEGTWMHEVRHSLSGKNLEIVLSGSVDLCVYIYQ